MPPVRRPGPDFGPTFNLLGQKHVLSILYALFRTSPLSFGELRSAVGCNPATLSDRLRKLEQFGLLERRALRVIPRRVEYRLTPMMQGFYPVWRQLIAWHRKFPPGGRPGETTTLPTERSPVPLGDAKDPRSSLKRRNT